MANHKKDITGFKKGVLTVIREAASKYEETQWVCLCKCGKEVTVSTWNLLKKSSKYSICFHDPNRKKLLIVWTNMKARCYNRNSVGYKDWGGRGIKVCDRWMKFRNFFDDVIDAYVPGLQIDRINNDGNYEITNIRWVTHKENGRNNRRCKITQSIAEQIRDSPSPTSQLAALHNLSRSTIHRIKNKKVWA